MAYTPNYYGNPYNMYGVSQPINQPIQPPVQQPINTPQAQVRTAYSEAEARSAQIPIDGSVVFFNDAQNGRIYTKRFDYTNGSFPFEIYRKEVDQPQQSAPQYVTVNQFETRIAELESAIQKWKVMQNDAAE